MQRYRGPWASWPFIEEYELFWIAGAIPDEAILFAFCFFRYILPHRGRRRRGGVIFTRHRKHCRAKLPGTERSKASPTPSRPSKLSFDSLLTFVVFSEVQHGCNSGTDRGQQNAARSGAAAQWSAGGFTASAPDRGSLRDAR